MFSKHSPLVTGTKATLTKGNTHSHSPYNVSVSTRAASASDVANLFLHAYESKRLDVVYLDFAKAFDKCDHEVIAHKLRDFGIGGKVGICIHQFLTKSLSKKGWVDSFWGEGCKVKRMFLFYNLDRILL